MSNSILLNQKNKIMMFFDRCPPDWLKPFLKEGAFTPTRDFLSDLVPQSRLEAILKYGFLNQMSTYDNFLVKDGDLFITSEDQIFKVQSKN